ncbi:hypothetical protein F5Y12DRAFT_711048 [Xylaria sp. FL1777]|nr:hypothetical protein F5Y12DRAFT_711048 [Xylaria sp. FL1777]
MFRPRISRALGASLFYFLFFSKRKWDDDNNDDNSNNNGDDDDSDDNDGDIGNKIIDTYKTRKRAQIPRRTRQPRGGEQMEARIKVNAVIRLGYLLLSSTDTSSKALRQFLGGAGRRQLACNAAGHNVTVYTEPAFLNEFNKSVPQTARSGNGFM